MSSTTELEPVPVSAGTPPIATSAQVSATLGCRGRPCSVRTIRDREWLSRIPHEQSESRS